MIRWTTTGAVGLLALIAGVVSFGHMHELAREAGERSLTAALIPFSVDGMIVASSMSLLVDSRAGRRGGVLPWTLLVLGSAASLAANVAAAVPTAEGRVIAAWPSFALMGAYELLMRQVRHAASSGLGTDERRGQALERVAKGGGHDPGMASVELSGAQAAGVAKPRTVVSLPGPGAVPQGAGISRSRGRMRRDTPRLTEAADLQQRAMDWALGNRSADGSLPTGRRIAEQFGRSDRWGRLVKQAVASTLGTETNEASDATEAA